VLPLAFALIMLAEPLTGTSPGKRTFGLKIVPCTDVPPSSQWLWYRGAIKSTPFWGLVVALLSGSWIIALCSVILGFAVLCSVALTPFLPGNPIHEILSHTRIVRIREIEALQENEGS
jgi:hypothetical protein